MPRSTESTTFTDPQHPTSAELAALVGLRVQLSPRPSAASRWSDLATGRLAIVAHGVGLSHASLVVRQCHAEQRMVNRAAEAALVRSVLTGAAQKAIAAELAIPASIASLRISAMLRDFGVRCTVRRAPMALALLAGYDAIGPAYTPPGYEEVPGAQVGYFELRLPRPEGVLRERLSQAEHEILRAIVEGRSHSQVGAERERSCRTIANQLRSIAVKLGVCGRFQYINLAVRLASGYS